LIIARFTGGSVGPVGINQIVSEFIKTRVFGSVLGKQKNLVKYSERQKNVDHSVSGFGSR
jgi:hypothetical protein